MISGRQQTQLAAAVQQLGLERVFGGRLEWLMQRLEQACGIYTTRAIEAPANAIPSSVSVAEFLSEYSSNPHRLGALLQAAAFLCTPEILAMIWMIEMGADVAKVSLQYEIRNSVDLAVTLGFGAHEQQVTFQSNELWDLAFLRLVGLSKADEQPLLSGVYPLRLNSQH